MARIALTLYLMLASMAGPCLCCCTAVRVLHSFSVAKIEKAQICTCCCGAAVPEEKETPTDNPVPSSPRRPCPCEQGQRNISILPAVERNLGVDIAALASLILENDAVVTLIAKPTDQAARATGEPVAFPYHNGRDILRALHILLC